MSRVMWRGYTRSVTSSGSVFDSATTTMTASPTTRCGTQAFHASSAKPNNHGETAKNAAATKSITK